MDVDDLLRLADVYADNNQLSKALDCCKEAIQKAPNDENPYFMKGQINYLSKNYLEAIGDFSKAIDIYPDEVFYLWRGICKERLDFDEWALEDYNDALKLNPNCATALTNKAALYERQNKWEESLELYIQALKVKKDWSFIYFQMSKLHLRLSEYEAAISAIKKAYQLEPLEEYKNLLSKIIKKSGSHPIHSFSNFFDGEIIENN